MMKKLFMIGNGFDLAHGLKTRYLDLFSWIYQENKQFVASFNDLLLRNFLSKNGYLIDDWQFKRSKNNLDLFIDRLSKQDIKRIQSSREYLMIKDNKYNDFETMRLYGMWCSLEEYMYYVYLDNEVNEMDIEYESLVGLLEEEDYGPIRKEDVEILDKKEQTKYDSLKDLSKQFKVYLNEWIDSINNEITKNCQKILPDNFFGNEDIIINFNYSNTIEVIYNKECFHFHGSNNSTNLPIMGHDGKNINHYSDKRALTLVYEFYKEIDSIMSQYEDIFKKANDVDKIVVLGLGYNKTDIDYFKKLYASCNDDVIWELYYYLDEDKTKAIDYVKSIGVKEENINAISIKHNSPYIKKK